MEISDILVRPLDKRIEEIIKVDQADEASVYADIEEYVATESIKDSYKKLFKAIAEAPTDPDEGIGVWISGFFGSGKSFFAKNLGYVLANLSVMGKPFADLFKEKIDDKSINDLIDSINSRIPTEVILFDVSADRAVKSGSQGLAEIMYRVLLRQLDYAEDFDIAELEFELEEEGKLEKFMTICNDEFGDWQKIRKGAQKFARASAILHKMDSRTYPNVNTWSESIHRIADITIKEIVERTFELMSRRRKGKALAFIIDEVGQYVARSADKIEDLRAVVEQFGKSSKNKVKNKEAIAPVWIVVTSQEKLGDVVAAIDSKRVELAKLQDRFKFRIDLKPADIKEVASKRVLGKKENASELLREMFSKVQGRLNASCKLERTSRLTDINEADFIQFYPYLPYYIDLSIQIMSGIRLQPGAPRHYGGSNRTIIKQAYEMMINERTNMGKKPLGTLVSLDLIYELVESNIATEKQMDINDISERFKGDSDVGIWPLRVAKAVCLLEFVRDLPRTERNIAAVLVNNVDQELPITEVQTAILKLEESQFIRNTEEGYKLQTAQEKNWESERRSIDIKPKDRNNISRDVISEIARDNNLLKYRFKGIKNFKVKLDIDGIKIEDGQIPLNIRIAGDESSFMSKVDEVRKDSREKNNNTEIYWVFALNSDIDSLIRKYHASDRMIVKYDQLRVQNKITQEELTCLTTENGERSRLKTRLNEKIKAAMSKGQGVFRGISKDASDLGKNLPEIIRNFLDFTVPDLYPKLEMGTRSLSGKEAEDVLKAANLKGLSQVFYESPTGFNLVIKEGAKYVPNQNAEIAQEVLNYIKSQSDFGETVNGRDLENYFGGLNYGWDRDVLRLVLSLLFRAGSIEVIHKGQRYSDYSEPEARSPLIKNADFKNASFVPHKPLDFKIQTTAVARYQELTGIEVDVDPNSIARALKEFAGKEKEKIFGDCATAKAERLAVLDIFEEYKGLIETILNSGRDDCVKILSEQGRSLKEKHDQANKIREALNEKNIRLVHLARSAISRMWLVLQNKGFEDIAKDVEALKVILDSKDFYEDLNDIQNLTKNIINKYKEVYSSWHKERNNSFTKIIDFIKGRSEFADLDSNSQDAVLSSLKTKVCENMDLLEGEIQCTNCLSGLNMLEADMASLDKLKGDALAQMQALIAPQQKIERVKMSKYFNSAIKTEEEVDEALKRLKDELLKLVAEGVTIILE